MEWTSERKNQLGLQSLADFLDEHGLRTKDPDTYVHGPEHYDCLDDKWAKGEVLGIIGASGSGKTQVTFEIFESILRKTQDRNSIVVFVSLEMTIQRIAKRWVSLVGRDSPLLNRLYIVSNYNEDGTSKELNTETIKREVRLQSIISPYTKRKGHICI